MQYSQEHLKTMVYAKFGGQTECIMGNWKIENIRSNCLKWGILKAFSSTKPAVAFGHVVKHQRTGVLSHNVN